MQTTYSLKNFVLKVWLPIVVFWTVLFMFGYPLPNIDDLFFTGAAINLAKGQDFTNPYLEVWNSALSSGKFYFQPPFYSYTLAGWIKLTGISTTNLRLFQYLCYNVFSLSAALLLRFYKFPKYTVFCTTFLFAAWHCNPNPYCGSGFRQDALGMAFLALGLWLLSGRNWWRYFLGFSFVESAAFTSPISVAYAFPFTVAILAIEFVNFQKAKNNNRQYFINIMLAFLAATLIIFTLFLLCINFDLQGFLSDFVLHASWRRTPTLKAIPVFIKLISQYYGMVLYVPSYILFLFLVAVTFVKGKQIRLDLKILLTALFAGMLLNILLYASAIFFIFFFCWLGIACIIPMIFNNKKPIIYAYLGTIVLFFSSQTLNILCLQKEYDPENKYREIKEVVLAKPSRKYAIDSIAARFVFDYNLPKNTINWNYLKPAPDANPNSSKDKKHDVTWIVSKSNLGHYVPEMQPDYPKIEFLGRKFNSLPKKPFDVIMIP
ncbi:MAG TPA: hypothetical protein DDW51_11065 [Cyanobacteria bacterium UBA11367]|nr:hypothetical protein [Cyanobacteria bacterium UBA11367]